MIVFWKVYDLSRFSCARMKQNIPIMIPYNVIADLFESNPIN